VERREPSTWQVAAIETIDAWTISFLRQRRRVHRQRRRDAVDLGLAVAGLPPHPPRRRARLRAAKQPFARLSSSAYARIEQEGATTALRGYDPAVYSGIDFIVLAADGVIKPLIQPAPNHLPWARTATSS
jgi:hypothetical protein